MSVKPIPESIWKHRGDTAWLEEHGRAALAEYLSLNDKQDQTYARESFAKVMFRDYQTGGLFAKAPRWWLEEQEKGLEKFKRDLAKIHPTFKGAWGGRNPWRDRPAREAKAESFPAVTVVETQGRTR